MILHGANPRFRRRGEEAHQGLGARIGRHVVADEEPEFRRQLGVGIGNARQAGLAVADEALQMADPEARTGWLP
jgi:hypothetical protein